MVTRHGKRSFAVLSYGFVGGTNQGLRLQGAKHEYLPHLTGNDCVMGLISFSSCYFCFACRPGNLNFGEGSDSAMRPFSATGTSEFVVVGWTVPSMGLPLFGSREGTNRWLRAYRRHIGRQMEDGCAAILDMSYATRRTYLYSCCRPVQGS